jgi:hypothetical protein
MPIASVVSSHSKKKEKDKQNNYTTSGNLEKETAKNPLKSRQKLKNTNSMVTNLKKIFTVFVLFIIPVALFAQKDVTQFLGIPIDGNKVEMIEKLKSKGFTISPNDKDVLVGQFNGTSVNVNIVTNNNKVCRIMVADVDYTNEIDIKIRFNNLLKQFKKNEKYMTASLTPEKYIIPDDEKISFEMLVNKKRYEAAFFQVPIKLDTVAIAGKIKSNLSTKYTEEQLSNPTEELRKEMTNASLPYMFEIFSKKSVWFMINELYGKYYITMYYDNEYNRANGEEL